MPLAFVLDSPFVSTGHFPLQKPEQIQFTITFAMLLRGHRPSKVRNLTSSSSLQQFTSFRGSISRRVESQKRLPISRSKITRPLISIRALVDDEKNSLRSSPSEQTTTSEIGLIGLAVMGQNLALNIAEKGFKISVFNRTYAKTEKAVQRAQKNQLGANLKGFENISDFIKSLQRPRKLIILVQAGKPVDSTIDNLLKNGLEAGDLIIDGGNEWYENTETRISKCAEKGVLYMGMGVSGGEEGARNGPSMMPGGSQEGYNYIKQIVEKVAAQVDDGPCVTYIGPGGSGNFVKMVHNGIEYGDMQLISEAYDILKTIGGLTNPELAQVFSEWNQTELESFLVQITSIILGVKDEDDGGSFVLDKIVDKTGSKGTGKWTVQQAAELSTAAPTITASLDGRYMSALKDQRVKAAAFYESLGLPQPQINTSINKAELINDVRKALYASKICSYAQGMNIIKAKSTEKDWGIDIGALARIWKGGCIIRAGFLDDIKRAYYNNPELENLLMDPFFAKALVTNETSWRKVVQLAVGAGVSVSGMTASLSYFDSFRRDKAPANLVQAQRDFFGSHTYQRFDKEGWFHTVWDASFGSEDSVTTTGYNA
eukprot:g7867.t1